MLFACQHTLRNDFSYSLRHLQKYVADEEGQELDEMVTLQTSERLQQMDDGEQGVDG